MAYHPYNYNPMYQNYGQPLYPQPQYSQVQQIQQTGSLIEVRYAKYEEAMPFLITEPNKKILFIITDRPMMVFKATDGMGISTTEQYKTQKVENLSEESKTAEIDTNLLVKKEDLNDFINKETLNSKFDEFSKTFNKQIEDLSRKIKIREILSEEAKDAK